MDKQFERSVIEKVMKELAKKGLLEDISLNHELQSPEPKVPEAELNRNHQPNEINHVDDHDINSYITLPPAKEILVENPKSVDAIKAMRQVTPARIGIGRAGARPRTATWLRFLADHAVAQDAVFLDVSEEFLQQMKLFSVQTTAENKEEFLTHPEKGRRLSAGAVETIKQKCQKDVQVQILVVDGLSSIAIEANIPDLLPALLQGLNVEGIKVGTPFFIKHGRVWVQDQVGTLLNADVVISLIGERPGLGTAESLSAYIIYRPNEKTVEADRTVVSNIHKGGIPPAEAGAHLCSVLKEILADKASGVKLNLNR